MRQLKRTVKIGNITIGGTNPIAVQTMLNVPVKDIAGTVEQAKRVAKAGCQIVTARFDMRPVRLFIGQQILHAANALIFHGDFLSRMVPLRGDISSDLTCRPERVS